MLGKEIPLPSKPILKTEITDESIRVVLRLQPYTNIEKKPVDSPDGWQYLLIKSDHSIPDEGSDNVKIFLIIWKKSDMENSLQHICLIDLCNPDKGCGNTSAATHQRGLWKIPSYNIEWVEWIHAHFLIFSASTEIYTRDWNDPHGKSSDLHWEKFKAFKYTIAVSPVEDLNKLVNKIIVAK